MLLKAFINTIFLSVFVLMMMAPAAYGAIVDKIAVIVNDEVITNGEIDRAMAPIYQQYQSIYRDKELVAKLEEARQKIIEQLIEDRLILSQAKKMNIDLDEKALDDKMNEASQRFSSKADFENALRAQSLTATSLRARYKEQLMARALVDREIGSKVIITPMELSGYYSAHGEEFAQPEEVLVRNILLRVTADKNTQKTLALAKEIARRLKEGGDFAALAKVYSEGPGASDGGLMGYVKRGDLMPEIEKAVFDMKEGQVSGMIQTSIGYHFLKVEGRREKRTRPFAEVKNEVEEAIFREKIKEDIKKWVEELKKKAYIALK